MGRKWGFYQAMYEKWRADSEPDSLVAGWADDDLMRVWSVGTTRHCPVSRPAVTSSRDSVSFSGPGRTVLSL